MNDPVKDLLDGFGAISETCGVLRGELMKNGFTRKEAVQIVQTYLVTLLSNSKNEEDK